MCLPHVVPFAQSPLYFLTVCTAQRRPALACADAMECLASIWSRSPEREGWHVGRFVLMPDHVHLFAMSGPRAVARGVWIKMWKSVSARQFLRSFGGAAPFWQADTFDHILRSAESYAEKWEYVAQNPVRAGLAKRAEDWPWQGEMQRLHF